MSTQFTREQMLKICTQARDEFEQHPERHATGSYLIDHDGESISYAWERGEVDARAIGQTCLIGQLSLRAKRVKPSLQRCTLIADVEQSNLGRLLVDLIDRHYSNALSPSMLNDAYGRMGAINLLNIAISRLELGETA